MPVLKTAIVIASGPSLTDEQVAAARASGHFTIVVCSTYELAPWANVLYAGDFLWWRTKIADVRKHFKGELWTQDNATHQRFQINRMRGTNRDGLGRDVIHLNGNSGTQAINLAYLWGYERILLLGFDMKLGPKGEKHWHADHPAPMVQGQTFGEWIHKLEKVARDLRELKIEVINCTPGSALPWFPMQDWKEVLGGNASRMQDQERAVLPTRGLRARPASLRVHSSREAEAGDFARLARDLEPEAWLR